MAAGVKGPWKPAKLAREQRALFLSGAGKQSGVFVEIIADSEFSPVFRKLEATGTWSDTVAIFATSRWRITTDLSGAKCFLRSQKLAAMQFHGLTWEKRQGKSWVEVTGASFRLGMASELQASLRPLAQEALRLGVEEHVRLTQFRCTAPDCPKGCGNSLAKDWGLPSLAALLGHLAFYHRSSPQYHEKVNEVWDQELADELEQREEGEELLRLFAASLTEHRYELWSQGDLKSETLTPNTHCRNIRFIAEKLGCEVSRTLAGDDEVYAQVREFHEDQKRHRHYSVSLRWLRKFTEVNALEAALARDAAGVKRRRLDEGRQAASGDSKSFEATAVPTEPVAVSKVTGDSAVDSLGKKAKAAQEKRRSPIAQAADPTECILRLFCRKLQPPTHRGDAGTLGARGPADAVPRQGAAHELAAAFAEVESGDALAAKRIAESLEPEMNSELISQAPPSLHSWLWAYCGAADSGRRAAVLKLLCAGTMRSSSELRSLNGALQKLLVVALSPLGAATDVLPAVQALSDMPVAEASENDLSLSKLTFFANKGFVFQELLGERGSGFSCGCVQFASFGGLLGRILSRGEDQRRHIQELCTFRSDTTYQAWHYRVSFLAALLWNMGGPTAFKEEMEAVMKSPVECVAADDLFHLRCIIEKPQQRQQPGETKERPAASFEEAERPVATPTRNSHSAGASVHSPSPTPKKLQEPMMTIRNVDTMKLMNGIKGQIRRRVIYSRVPGFQLQLHDETGQIQVKFWKDAAKYQNDPRLEEGAVVFLRGYRLVQLKTEQLELAPSGRRHCLCYDSADAVQIELLQGIPEASVAEASAMPVNARLSLRCYVQSVEDGGRRGTTTTITNVAIIVITIIIIIICIITVIIIVVVIVLIFIIVVSITVIVVSIIVVIITAAMSLNQVPVER
eukprot:s1388_g10.t1